MEKVRKREICAALLGTTIAAILWITILGRKETVENVIIFRPFHSMHSIISGIKRQGIRSNFLGNILMFIPVGLFFPVVIPWGRRWYRTGLIGFSISLLVEIIQLITAKGYFEIDDMILNTFGTIVGFILLLAVTQKEREGQNYDEHIGNRRGRSIRSQSGREFKGNTGGEESDKTSAEDRRNL